LHTKAITIWNNQDEAWTNVVAGIRQVIEELPAHSVFGPSEIGDAVTAQAPRCRADIRQH
jgi:hypothetical protein